MILRKQQKKEVKEAKAEGPFWHLSLLAHQVVTNMDVLFAEASAEEKVIAPMTTLKYAYDSVPFWFKPKLGGPRIHFPAVLRYGRATGIEGTASWAVVGDWLSHYFVLKATKLAIQCGTRRGYPSRRRTRKEQTASCSIYLGRRCSTAAIPYLGNS